MMEVPERKVFLDGHQSQLKALELVLNGRDDLFWVVVIAMELCGLVQPIILTTEFYVMDDLTPPLVVTNSSSRVTSPSTRQ